MKSSQLRPLIPNLNRGKKKEINSSACRECTEFYLRDLLDTAADVGPCYPKEALGKAIPKTDQNGRILPIFAINLCITSPRSRDELLACLLRRASYDRADVFNVNPIFVGKQNSQAARYGGKRSEACNAQILSNQVIILVDASDYRGWNE
ncbi:MAG: hypothetical protein ACREIM_10515 [Nitrospiraceae bacterium]